MSEEQGFSVRYNPDNPPPNTRYEVISILPERKLPPIQLRLTVTCPQCGFNYTIDNSGAQVHPTLKGLMILGSVGSEPHCEHEGVRISIVVAAECSVRFGFPDV